MGTGAARIWLKHRVATLAAALLVLLALGHAAVVGARVQQAPSSRIAIDLPEGYEPAKLFSGFTNEVFGISLVTVEMPAQAYDELAKGLTTEALATKGVTLLSRGELAKPGPHIYIRGEQATAGGIFAKFFVVFRDKEVTALVTANVPKAAIDSGQVKVPDIEAMLASTRIADAPAEAKELFTLSYMGPFKPAGTFLGTAKAFTLDGRPGPPSAASGRPMLIVAPSLDRRPVTKLDDYAVQLMQGVGGHQDLRIASKAPVTIGGLAGTEIEAQARERDNGDELLLYQAVLLPPEGGYWRIFGQAPWAERERYLAEFRKIAAGFSLRP